MKYSSTQNKRNKRANVSASKQTQNKIFIMFYRLVFAAVIVGAFFAAGAGIGAYLGIIKEAPKIEKFFAATSENFTTIIYSAETGEEIDRLDSGENREYAPLSKIPEYLQNAFIALEDERFYEHDGVDIRGLFRAAYQSVLGDKQGASTITQQLIKNKRGYMSNTIVTKLQEQYLAVQYEKNLAAALGGKDAAKKYILETYLNLVGLGHGQIGVQAAAQRYFGKDVSALTLSEACVIAAITQNPTGYSPVNYPEKNKKRQTVALDYMLKFGWITEEEHDTAMEDDVYARVAAVQSESYAVPSLHDYYTDALIEQISADLQEERGMTRQEAMNLLYTGGLKIYSAVDQTAQKIVDEALLNEEIFPKAEFEISVTYLIAVRNTITNRVTDYTREKTVKTLDEAEAFKESVKDSLLTETSELVQERFFAIPQPQIGFAVIDYRTGQVKAIGGGRGEKTINRGLNRATQSARQPGSVFKVLAAFLPAIDLGIVTAGTVIDDVPMIFGDHEFHNWYPEKFRGLSTIRQGVYNSMNLLAVTTLNRVGVENAYNYLLNFGFTTLDPVNDKNLSTALGGITHGVTQLEVAAAYGSIANQGIYNKPTFYTQVLDHDGNLLLEYTPSNKRIMKETTSYIMTDMMKDVIIRGTGSHISFKDINGATMNIAGKTGTTTNDKDLTFAGYTPYYSAAIYMGYDMPKQMRSASSSVHKQIWSYIMEKIHTAKGLTNQDFPKAEGIVTAKICTQSGLLAVEGLCDADPRANQVRTEIYAIGTAPTTYCETHLRYQACIHQNEDGTATAYVPSVACPQGSVVEKVGIIRQDPEARGIPSDSEYEVPGNILDGVVCPYHTQQGVPSPGDPGITTPEYEGEQDSPPNFGFPR